MRRFDNGISSYRCVECSRQFATFDEIERHHCDRRTGLEDDDYPPYAKDYALAAGRLAAELQLQIREERRRQLQQDRLIVVAAGLVAGVAIGGLLIAYGVF